MTGDSGSDLAVMRNDIDHIKKTVDKISLDYETRLRALEQTKEDCQQEHRLDKIETKLTDTTKKIDDHLSETCGEEKGSQYLRDLLMVGAGAAISFLVAAGLGKVF